jgi:hypothetical protein
VKSALLLPIGNFTGQVLNLLPCLLVFLHFPFEKAKGQGGLSLQATGCKDIEIAKLIFRILEPVHLDKPLFDQLCEAIVDLSQADAHLGGHFTLGEVMVAAQDLEQAVVNLLVKVVHGVNIKELRGLCQGEIWLVSLVESVRNVRSVRKVLFVKWVIGYR